MSQADMDAFEKFEKVAAGDSLPIEPALPDGEYAIVEVLGHRTIIGRVEEVDRFGAKLMSIQAIFAGKLLNAVLISGGSIYQYTPCSREVAVERAPSELYHLPMSIRAALPLDMLAAPDAPSRSYDVELPCRSCGSDVGGECDSCVPF